MKPKKIKPTPSHWILTLYWWNPLVYLVLLFQLFYNLWDGGLKEYCEILHGMITEYDWL